MHLSRKMRREGSRVSEFEIKKRNQVSKERKKEAGKEYRKGGKQQGGKIAQKEVKTKWKTASNEGSTDKARHEVNKERTEVGSKEEKKEAITDGRNKGSKQASEE